VVGLALRLFLGLFLATTVSAVAAEPTLVVLVGDGSLMVFRVGDAGSARTIVPKGVTGQLVGIDRRPADGRLYGVTGSDVYSLDPTTGAASLVSTLTAPFDGGTRSGVDFTPQLDRLRLVSADGRNVRVNVALGATAADTPLAYAAGDPNFGARPRVTAAGYGNNRPGVATTTLFEIDAGLDVLVVQDPANDGVLKTIGPIGVDVPEIAGFDVVTDADGRDRAFAGWGTTLHTIDLATGHATPIGPVPGAGRPVVSLSIIDDPPGP
jgi:hypothetical protein